MTIDCKMNASYCLPRAPHLAASEERLRVNSRWLDYSIIKLRWIKLMREGAIQLISVVGRWA